jgi:Tol biopolymer transport system component
MRASVMSPICTWNWDVWVMNADGTGQERVTTQLGADIYPNWTPDGTEIVYAACPNLLAFDVYKANVSTGSKQQLTTTTFTSEWGTVYSPSGDFIAYNSDATGNTDIYLQSVIGGSLTNLTNNPAEDLSPTWYDGTALNTTISGRVTDFAGNPIEGASISTGTGITVTTAGNGAYLITGYL